MNLKTSLFDKSIIKSDFKRFWWITAVFLLLLVLFVLPQAVYNPDYPKAYADSITINTDEGMLALLFAYFSSGMLFSYLHKGSAVSMLHGLPVSRKKQYFSHIFSGAVLLFIPVFIASLTICIECLYNGTGEMFALKSGAGYFYTCAVYAALVFMITAFSVMISGTTSMAYLFSVGFMILPAYVLSIVEYIFNDNLYGFVYKNWSTLISKIYLVSISEVCSRKSLLYIAAIAVLLVLTYILYQKRQLENYDEVVAFKFLKPVFMYTMATCFGFFGCVLINDIWGKTLFLGMLPLGCAALIASFMLNQKSFGIRGIFKPICIFIIAVGIFKLAFVFDITGYERRVPNAEDVVSIEPYNSEDYYDNGIPYDFMDTYKEIRGKAEITDSAEIQRLIDFHETLVANRKIDRVSNASTTWVGFKYNLSNGRSFERRYSVNEELYREYLKDYYENDVYKKVRFPFINSLEKQIDYVEYSGILGNTRLQNIDFTTLTQAVKEDIDNLKYEDISYINMNYISDYITINYTQYVPYEGKIKEFSGYMEVPLNGCFKNTTVLVNEELEKYSGMLRSADDVDSVYITYIPSNSDTTEEQKFSVTDEYDVRTIFRELQSVDYSLEDVEDSTKTVLSFSFAKDGADVYDCTICRPYNEFPATVRKYVKR